MRRSEPADRVVRVLEALRERAGAPARFADIARAADVSQATCHSILASLVDAGYVHRDAQHKTYTLGPALVALADVAAPSLRGWAVLQPLLDDLARRTGRPCSAAEAVGDSITIIATAMPPDAPDHQLQVQVGARVPFAPPFGAIHVAGADPETIDAWVARDTGSTRTPEQLRAIVRDHRAAGVAVAPATPASAPLREALVALGSHPDAEDLRERTLDLLASIDRLDYSAAEVASDADLPVNTITAPVVGPDGRIAFAVGIHPEGPHLDRPRRDALIAELRRTTDAMAQRIAASADSTASTPISTRTTGAA